MKKYFLFLCSVILLFSLAQSSYGCAVCFGAPGTTVTLAIGNAILFLLGVVGLVLLSIVAFVICLAYRAKKAQSREIVLGLKELTNA
jgi:hypothetical protein